MASRDDYFRCKVCHQLFLDEQAFRDPIKGLQCPNGCEEPFEQPAYQSPLISDDNDSSDGQEALWALRPFIWHSEH